MVHWLIMTMCSDMSIEDVKHNLRIADSDGIKSDGGGINALAISKAPLVN